MGPRTSVARRGCLWVFRHDEKGGLGHRVHAGVVRPMVPAGAVSELPALGILSPIEGTASGTGYASATVHVGASSAHCRPASLQGSRPVFTQRRSPRGCAHARSGGRPRPSFQGPHDGSRSGGRCVVFPVCLLHPVPSIAESPSSLNRNRILRPVPDDGPCRMVGPGRADAVV